LALVLAGVSSVDARDSRDELELVPHRPQHENVEIVAEIAA
jgi:hypothetical protein